MSAATFEYVVNFTIAHEGDTPFMYNNWPLKNSIKDVTTGVGHALFTEDEAASPEVRRMFTLKATGGGPGLVHHDQVVCLASWAPW